MSANDEITSQENADNEEELPKWMRYLPKSNIFSNIKPLLSSTDDPIPTSEHTGKRRIVKVKKSCNSFGPTSHHAMTVESKLRTDKRKRIEVEDPKGEQGIVETSARRKVRCRSTNMSEAAELFSIVKLK